MQLKGWAKNIIHGKNIMEYRKLIPTVWGKMLIEPGIAWNKKNRKEIPAKFWLINTIY